MSLACNTSVEHIPTEVWQHIFAYLPVKQVIKIRQVCSLWRDTVDGLAGSNSFWRTHCKRDFSDVYNTAYHKARVGTQWFNIYRSLTLWPQLTHAKETRNEFAVVDYSDDDDDDNDIISMQVLQDGVVGVLKKKEIIYYDTETMEPIRSHTLRVNDDDDFYDLVSYDKYEENQHILQFLDFSLRLFVIFKTTDNPNYEVNAKFCGVDRALLVNEEIFYVDLQNNVYTCKLFDGKVTTTKLTQPKEKIMCLGYTDQLNYLTRQGNIYSLVDGNETFCSHVMHSTNIIDQLHKYNLFEAVDWDVIGFWYKRMHLHVDQGLLESICTVKVYGKVVLVCCGDSNFYIYYDPFINGEFDILNSQPVKKYNFEDPQNGLILEADALETEDGHTVLVATTKKIIALDFIHPVPKLK